MASNKKAELLKDIIKLAGLIQTTDSLQDTVDLIKRAVNPNPSSSFPLVDVISIIYESLRKGRLGLGLSMCKIAAVVNPSKFIREAKRSGIFKPSKYNFQTKNISSLIKVLMNGSELFLFTDDEIKYLNSMLNLLRLADEVGELQLGLLANKNATSATAIKNMFVCLDRAFWPCSDEQRARLAIAYEEHIDGGNLQVESIASGISLVLSKILNTRKFRKKDVVFVGAGQIKRGDTDFLVKAGIKIQEYLDIETLVNSFPYFIESENENLVLFSADPDLEKSVRLGYVLTILQSMSRAVYSGAHEPVSVKIESLADSFFNRFNGNLIELKNISGTKRYVISFPNDAKTIELFGSNSLFQEELEYLYGTALDAFVSIGFLIEAELVEGISLMDLIRVRRLFIFMSMITFKAISQHADEEDFEFIDAASRIPVLNNETLRKLLEISVGPSKVDLLIKHLTFDPAMNEFFDIQYRPLVKIADVYLVSLGVIANSDIVRNVLCEHSVRIHAAIESDPMQDAIKNAMECNGFLVADNIERKSRGAHFEIDLIAFKDNVLFIFECKNSFHPCGAHEMRTSFTHIEKAGSQLDRIEKWVKSLANQSLLLRELGWSASEPVSIKTCIVTANRVFNGYCYGHHPVRYAGEVLNVLGTGEIVVDGAFYRTWKSDTFHAEDLTTYLSGGGISGMNQDSMVEMERVQKFGNLNVIRRTFGFDVSLAQSLASKRFTQLTEDEYMRNMQLRNFAPANMELLKS